jgi:AcrR family transcriptional regulator
MTAAATRRDILEAASRLFAERGYGQVTVGDIAREARTAVKTVYASAGGKTDILNEIVQDAVAASGARRTVDEARAETDPAGVIDVLARGTRRGNEHHRLAIAVLYGALPVDESARALWLRATAVYREALSDIAAHLDALGGLRDGMSAERCADVLWFCFGLGAWRTLVVECGWSWEDAQAELTRTAVRTLIAVHEGSASGGAAKG